MKTLFAILVFCVTTSSIMAGSVVFESSNLPIVVIDTHGQAIPDAYRIVADMGIIYNGPGQRNYLNDPYNNYNGRISIELRGSSSQMFPKKQYALETQDAQGENLNISLLGLPAENDWILNGPYSDKSLIRNVLIYRLARDLGHYASRTRFCELVLNGDYRGVYVLMEKIKRDKHRVHIAKLKPDEITGDDLTGGYIIKIDKLAGENVAGWYSIFPPYAESKHRIFYQYHYPKPDEIVDEQKDYIQNVIYDFERTLFDKDYQNPQTGYYGQVDLASFVDYFILNEISRNVDGYRLSAFLYKDKDSNDPRLHAGPIWDFNIAFGNADYYHAYSPEGWQVNINHDPQFVAWDDPFQVPFWWGKLVADSTFMKQVILRWKALRTNLLAQERLFALIDSYADTLSEAQVRNFERWPVLGTHVWPNYYVGQTYQDEIAYLKSWLEQRLNWMDSQLLDSQPPTPPRNVQAEAITSYSVVLHWEASSDNAGIAGYDVFNGEKRLATTTNLTVTITDLKDNHPYLLEVRARDFAGNYSQDNPTVAFTTQPFTAKDGIFCQAVSVPPILDGQIDGQWNGAEWQEVGHLLSGSIDNPQDFSGKFKVLWDNQNLYLLVRVYDDVKMRDSGSNFYQDDDLEVYFDTDNSKNDFYDADDFRFRFTYQDSLIVEKAHGNTDGVHSAMALLDDGYRMEVRFPWETLHGQPGTEKVLGFEIQLNDDDNGGDRDAKLAWWGTSDDAYLHPSAFGALKLKGNPTAISPKTQLPHKFTLVNNRPNPFNASTRIEFSLARPERLTLRVFDVNGRLMKTLLKNRAFTAGRHHIMLNARSWASGIYFYRLQVTGSTMVFSGRMLLIK